MSNSPLSVPDAATRFFDNFLNCQIKASIPEKRRRWHVKRVNEFIKAQNVRKIKTLTRIDIARHFETIGRKTALVAGNISNVLPQSEYSIVNCLRPGCVRM